MDPFVLYFRRLKRLLQGKVRSREDAEDLIQEAFLRMQEYCQKGGQVRQPEGFLVRTVTRLAINARRDNHQKLYSDAKPEDLTYLIDAQPRPDEVLAADECLLRMRAALDATSRRTREVFFMHRLDGLSYAQIAQEMNLSLSSIEKMIASAMATLAAHNKREQQ